MPQVDSQHPLLPSLLDRLIDFEPDVSSEPLWRHTFTLGELKEQVRRDLEFLLNTRHARTDLTEQQCQLSRSCLTYGLPDFTSWTVGGPQALERLRRAVEQAIHDFEPRLTDVQVVVREPEQQYDRSFHLTIQAVLHVEPVIEPVAFDTVVETSTGVCDVRSS